MDGILEMWEKAPNGEELAKALLKEREEQKRIAAEPKSAIIDPTNSYGIGGTRSKQAIVPFSVLRRMAKVPAIAAILLTRKNQVARFARRPRFDGDIGFKIGLKDIKAKMSDAQQKKAHDIEELFLKTGAVKNKKRKDNFDSFLRKSVDDSLTIDVMAWEKVRNLKGAIAEIWAIDGTTIELVSNAPVGEDNQPYVYVPETRRGQGISGDIAYVQRLNGKIEAEYTEDDLTYAVRNPSTDIMTTDFGTSELEILMEIVTGILNGVRYNTTYFSHSHVPQGVLEIVGKYKDEHLESFKRHWKNLTSGAAGKWAVPVMALQEGAGVKWTPFKNTNQDMQFNEFLEFLFNVACAVYQIDPNEVGFKSWTSNSGAATKSDNTEEKMDKSKDKGLIPLMNFIGNNLNEIVEEIDEEYALYWVGLDEDDEDRKAERQEKAIGSGIKTVAMVWAENGVDIDEIKKQNGGELPKWANAPANAQLIQVYMAEQGLGQETDPNDPNAPDEEGMQDADHAHEAGMQDTKHKQALEVMDKTHSQAKEMKELDHKHATNLEKVKASNTSKLEDQKQEGAHAMEDKKQEGAHAMEDKKQEGASEMEDKKAGIAKESAKDAAKNAPKEEGKAEPDPDDEHEKKLELMEQEHAQNLKEKKVDHEHETKIEKMKAQAARSNKALKKSLETDDDGTLNITITWDNY